MTPAQDNDYQSLQRTIAELTVENERLKVDGAEYIRLTDPLVSCAAWLHGGEQVPQCGTCRGCLMVDRERLDWLEARAYMVYRDRDPESRQLCDHATVVNEDEPGGRRGIIGPTLRSAIDQARAQ